jgi:heme-degrading monooxygenase HmoA
MIVRHWSGIVKRTRAEDYLAHLRAETFPHLRTIPGFLGARILRRELDAGTEYLVITRWASMEAVRRFAGADPDAAVVPPQVQAMMVAYDDRVRHYEPVQPGVQG